MRSFGPLPLGPSVPVPAAAAAVLSKKDIAKKMEDRREEGLQQKIGEVRMYIRARALLFFFFFVPKLTVRHGYFRICIDDGYVPIYEMDVTLSYVCSAAVTINSRTAGIVAVELVAGYVLNATRTAAHLAVVDVAETTGNSEGQWDDSFVCSNPMVYCCMLLYLD